MQVGEGRTRATGRDERDQHHLGTLIMFGRLRVCTTLRGPGSPPSEQVTVGPSWLETRLASASRFYFRLESSFARLGRGGVCPYANLRITLLQMSIRDRAGYRRDEPRTRRTRAAG